MSTYSNISFSIENSRGSDIQARDIAHALSLICRANGHFIRFYSVAQHSLNCYREATARGLSDKVRLICLLHDASEAYISDIIRPVKACLPQYQVLEKNLQQRIFERFGLPVLSEQEIALSKEIDNAVLDYEFDALHVGGSWDELPSVSAKFDFSFRDMKSVEQEFMDTLHVLGAIPD